MVFPCQLVPPSASRPSKPFLNLPTDVNLSQDHFIICGLGSLGQHTIVNLKKFSRAPYEVSIAAIDLKIPVYWEIDNLPSLLVEPPIVGDSRRYDLLKRAGINHCRTILLLTSDESVNVETALAARRLNPSVHIVLRSSRYNLNQLLQRQLGHFVALDATELPATTFALAGLGDDILSIFKIDDYQFRVVQHQTPAGDLRYSQMPLHRLHRRDARLLDLRPQQPPSQPLGWATTASTIFHRWQPHVKVQAGDQITYIEIDHPRLRIEKPPPGRLWGKFKCRLEELVNNSWRQRFFSFWRRDEQQSLRRVFLIAVSTGLTLWLIGALLLKKAIPALSWMKAISLGVILLLGGYGDVFGGIEEVAVPAWLLLVCLLIALISLLLVLSVFGLLADRLLSSRFEFLRRRPHLPKADHIIVVGLGRLGHRVISILREFNQPLIGITHQLRYPELLDQVPLLIGNVLQKLPTANLATARSVIAVTDDPMLNLEIALIASEATTVQGNALPFTPVIRTINQAFSDNLAVLLPQAKAFSVYALSAEAFAGAAFGENILSLFPLQNQTILVTEYCIEEGDTLNGKLLAEIAYGYGVVPLLLKTYSLQGVWSTVTMPGDDLRLHSGDQLYVLSSINGLRRIERGEMAAPRRWRLKMERPLNPQVLLTAGNTLVRLSDLELSRCRDLMANLPVAIDLSLYDYQAYRLLQELQRYIPTQLSPA